MNEFNFKYMQNYHGNSVGSTGDKASKKDATFDEGRERKHGIHMILDSLLRPKWIESGKKRLPESIKY